MCSLQHLLLLQLRIFFQQICSSQILETQGKERNFICVLAVTHCSICQVAYYLFRTITFFQYCNYRMGKIHVNFQLNMEYVHNFRFLQSLCGQTAWFIHIFHIFQENSGKVESG